MKTLNLIKYIVIFLLLAIPAKGADICPDKVNGWGLTEEEIDTIHETIYKSHLLWQVNFSALKDRIVFNPVSLASCRIFNNDRPLSDFFPSRIKDDEIEFNIRRRTSRSREDSLSLIPWSTIHYSGWEIRGLTDDFDEFPIHLPGIIGGRDWEYQDFNPRPVEKIDEHGDTTRYMIYKLYYDEKNIRGKIGVNVEDAGDIIFFSGPFTHVKDHGSWIIDELGKNPFFPLELSLQEAYEKLRDQKKIPDTITFEQYIGSRAYVELLYWNAIAFEEKHVNIDYLGYNEEGFLRFKAELNYTNSPNYPLCTTYDSKDAEKCSSNWRFYQYVQCNMMDHNIRSVIVPDEPPGIRPRTPQLIKHKYFLKSLEIKINPHSGEVLISGEKDRQLGKLPECR